MQNYLLVALGGASGAVMRYALSRAFPAAPGGWPWPTFLANSLGGLLIGVLAAVVASRGPQGEAWRLLLGVGVLGGFTTFSAFSLETVQLVQQGRHGLALGYALASVSISVLAVFAGLFLARRWA